MASSDGSPRSTGRNKLSAAFVRQATTPGIFIDGGGLRFQVTRAAGRRWFMRVTVNGKPRDLALGTADIVSMSEAREIASAVRKAVGEGSDPVDALRRHRERANPTTAVAVRAPTFRDAWKAFWELKAPQLTSDKNRRLRVNQMERYALAFIGDRPVAEIRSAEIIEMLRPIWRAKEETARKVLQRVDAVFISSITREWRERASPCVGVAQELGRRRIETTHFAAMHYSAVPSFLLELRTRGGLLTSRLCLELVVLTAVRSGEARGARWCEVNLDTATWTIPRGRMKMNVEHVVPLSGRAIKILAEARAAHPSSALIFPGTKGQELSDMTLLMLLRRQGLGGAATIHGFRSSFKDWCAELGVRDETSEAALAHRDRDAVRAAYRRTNYLDERRELMQRWAAHCCGYPQTAKDRT